MWQCLWVLWHSHGMKIHLKFVDGFPPTHSLKEISFNKGQPHVIPQAGDQVKQGPFNRKVQYREIEYGSNEITVTLVMTSAV